MYGSPGPVLLYALPARETHFVLTRDCFQKRIDKGGLTDACLASNEHHSTLACERLRMPATQPRRFILAADDDRR
jgi:hypothetical protein